MKKNLLKEITPLTQNDCFTLFSRVKSGFDFPLHYHEEFELNFIRGAKGARRVVGDHVEEIDDLEHAWFNHQCRSKEIHEITIQFHKDLFDEKLLRRNQLSFIRNMFDKSSRGILFPKETILAVAPRIAELNQKHGFDSVLELISILHDLSIARNLRILSDSAFANEQFSYNSRRIEKTFDYMNKNFDRTITLSEVSKLANMSDVSFSRFFRQRTGNTFIDSLTEIRLGHASRILIDSSNSIAEVAYHCGFNNISNFNRIFKKKKGCTPREFRESFSGTRIFI
jgi:AraC-like DNA-binding protein